MLYTFVFTSYPLINVLTTTQRHVNPVRTRNTQFLGLSKVLRLRKIIIKEHI